MKINAKFNKRCAFCRYWYDPTNSCIDITRSPNVWEVDTKARNICRKLNISKAATAYCSKYECKLDIV